MCVIEAQRVENIAVTVKHKFHGLRASWLLVLFKILAISRSIYCRDVYSNVARGQTMKLVLSIDRIIFCRIDLLTCRSLLRVLGILKQGCTPSLL